MGDKKPPELDLKNWKSFINKQGILTDSLWLLSKRDGSGAHSDIFHGGFIPQLPRQAILRFTKPFDTVIDAFLGYGSTLIECRRWGRHGVGVEINKEIFGLAQKRIENEPNNYDAKTFTVHGDSATINFKSLLEKKGLQKASLVVLHPPYHNIIDYGKDQDNLCNAPSLKSFLKKYSEIVENISQAMTTSGYLELVIGDKYENGEWIPLGFYLMNETIKKGFKLKSICIKNIENTIGKRNQIHLWKYRALKSGFYIFKHEYVIFFQKNESSLDTCYKLC